MEDTATSMTSFELPQYPASNGSASNAYASSTQLRPESKRHSIKAKQERRQALYLDEGQAHTVWKPKRAARKPLSGIATAMHEMEKHKQDLHERQQKLLSRVQATRKVLKVHKEELATLDEGMAEEDTQRRTSEKKRWRNAITRVMEENEETRKRKQSNRKKRSMYFHDIVTQYVEAMVKAKGEAADMQTAANPEAPKAPRTRATANSLKMAPLHRRAMPLRQWKSLVFDDHLKTTAAAETREKHLSQPFEAGSREMTTSDCISEEDCPSTASVGDMTQRENNQSGTPLTFSNDNVM